MITQNDFLNFAFEEAINEVNPNAVEKDVLKATIKTGMMAYAEREGCHFTDEEVAEKIEEGIAELDSAKKDFEF
jgi:predicted transcriptional regulator